MSENDNQAHRRFAYSDWPSLQPDLMRYAPDLPQPGPLAQLGESVAIGSGQSPNRLAVQPMEGCDGLSDGSPSELTLRRYRRFAAGGAGLVWVEATAVVPEGRANPRQLWLHEDTAASFASLVDLIDREAPKRPYKVLQLTHSGRYARPVDKPWPQVAVANPWLDKPGQELSILTDEQLDGLIPAYVEAARLARAAGFDAVDIKACHRYLINELLSAHTRDDRYGGSLENRARFLLAIVQSIRAAVPIDLAVRLNAYDEIPWPYGWGVRQDDCRQPDLNEPGWLVRALAAAGVCLINVTGGNPYYNPHVNRPYDIGPYQPPQHQLIHTGKLLRAVRDLKAAAPGVCFIASGLSWLRQLAGPLSAGLVANDWCDLVGFGRQAFAYPEFAQDLLSGGLVPERCCLSCGKCSEIMRDGGTSGCVLRDGELYRPIYQTGRAGKAPIASNRIAEHV